MNVQELLNNITPAIYQNLKRAIELGKWPDGSKVSSEQRQFCMQAVIAYEHKNLAPEEHTGYIAPEPHTYCADDHDHDHSDSDHPDQVKPIKWVE